MASLTTKNGKTEIRLIVNEKELRLRGLTNRREAERLAGKLDDLKAGLRTGALSPELTVWVSKLETASPDIYDRLARVGLVPCRAKPRTLKDLLEAHRKRSDVIEESRVVWDKVARNLIDYFGENKPVAEITPEGALEFEQWLRTAPLNRRNKIPTAYSDSTVNKRIGNVKTFFYTHRRLKYPFCATLCEPWCVAPTADGTGNFNAKYYITGKSWAGLKKARFDFFNAGIR